MDINRIAVKHVRIDKVDELSRLQGSKYVQSSIIESFDLIKKDLAKGSLVLFSGTPCQVVAIKNVFRNYDNLYTADLICHGVPSPKVFKDYINWIKCKYGAIKSFRFRIHSRYSIQGYHAFAICERGIYKRSAQEDPFYHAFIHEIGYRNSCYKCKYSTKNRLGDITFGDCNSIIYNDPKFTKSNCASLVILNTNKGKELFNISREEFQYKKIDLSDEIRYNKRIIETSKKDRQKSELFWDLYRKGYLFDKYPLYNKKSVIYMFKRLLMRIIPDYWVRVIRKRIRGKQK